MDKDIKEVYRVNKDREERKDKIIEELKGVIDTLISEIN